MAFQDTIFSRPVSVVTPVVSSLAGMLRKYISSVLPKGYLKDYFVDTELPYLPRRNRRRFRPLSPSKIDLRHLPLLSVRIEVTADQSDFATGTTFWTSTKFMRDPTQLGRIIGDDVNQLYCGYEVERAVIRFQVSFTVESDMKANELAMYLRRTLPVNSKFYLNDIDIATEMPPDIVRGVWSALNMGDSADPNNVEAFSQYMRTATQGNVEPLVNSANGRVAYAYSYRANPLMSITGAPTVTVNRDGNVVRNAQVDLPFEADVMVPVAYALRAEVSLPSSGDDLVGTDIGNMDNGNAYFSAGVRMRPPLNLPGGLDLVFYSSLITGDPDPADPMAPDVTDFSASIGDRSRTLVAALLAAGKTDKVDAKLWLDGNPTDPAHWEFDPNTWRLEIHKPVLQSRQKYHFAVYADKTDMKTLAPESRRPQPPSPMIRRKV